MSNPAKFRIESHDHADKNFSISNEEIVLIVDYDDVDHDAVDRAAKKVARILNKYWETE